LFSYFHEKKVLFVLNSLVENGGAERRTLDQVLYFKKKGYQADVCAIRHIGPMAKQFKARGIQVNFFRVYETPEGQKVKIFFTNFVRFFLFILRGRYKIVIGAQPPSHYLVRFACFPPMGRKIFTIERGNRFFRKRKYHFWDRMCSHWTNKLICISQATRDGLIETSGVKPEKMVVILEGYQKIPCQVPPTDLANQLKGKHVFGCVGHFVATKRQDVLIKAFKRVYEKVSEARLVLVGDGVMKPKWRFLVKDPGIENAVIFTGNVENPHCYYPLFDIFVFPSILEGLAGVVVEAWLHKLPVICANVRPMSDYVEHQVNGILFTPDDERDLSKWMTYLVMHKEIRESLGRAGYAKAEADFDYERQLGKFFQLIVG